MLKLMNISATPWDFDKFENDSLKLKAFMGKHNIDGVEMLQYANWNDSIVAHSLMIGVHACFWPIWLDFWREDNEELLRQFGDKEGYTEYYRCSSKSELVEYYRRELKKAGEVGVKYVLFHVSHVELEHCFNYEFTYSDEEIVEAFIEMINLVLEGMEPGFEVLFENHWFPGLTLLDKALAKKLLDEVKYPNKGFVLDIGHMMNTNLGLRTEEEAADYILHVLENLGELAGNIRVIHLNSALSGEYVEKAKKNNAAFNSDAGLKEKHIAVYGHIAKIDTHIPFTHPSITKIINYIKPEYLVYEFIAQSLPELSEFMEMQNAVLFAERS